MDMIREARSILEGEFALVIRELDLLACLRLPVGCCGLVASLCGHRIGSLTYHTVRECRRYGYCHPPDQSQEELSSFPSDQRTNQSSVQFRNIQTDHRPQHQKHTVSDQEPELLTLPPRYTYFQQPQQVLEELSIQLYLLPPRCFTLACCCLIRCFGGTPYGSGLLLGNCIPYAVYEGDEESEVDGARYACSVLEVQPCEVVNYGFGRRAGEAVGRKRFRKDSHGYRGRGIGLMREVDAVRRAAWRSGLWWPISVHTQCCGMRSIVV